MKVTIQFQDQDDANSFAVYVQKARLQDGTVGGLYSGRICSILKHADIQPPSPSSPSSDEVTRLRTRLAEHDGCSRWGVKDAIALKKD